MTFHFNFVVNHCFFITEFYLCACTSLSVPINQIHTHTLTAWTEAL